MMQLTRFSRVGTITVIMFFCQLSYAKHSGQPQKVNENFKYTFFGSNIFPWITGEKSGFVEDTENAHTKLLKKMILQSNESLKLALYGVQKQSWLVEALKKMSSKAKTFQMVVDQKDGKLNEWKESNFTYPDTAALGKFLGPKHIFPDVNKNDEPRKSSIMHNKFIVFDHSAVWTGSANTTHTDLGAEYNANTSILIESKEVAEIYTQEFDQMFTQHKFSTQKESLEGNQELEFRDGTKLAIYFAPEDEATEEAIVGSIESAKKTVDIGMFYLTHRDIADALTRAISRGIQVRLIYDSVASKHESSLHIELWKNGVDVRVENWGGKMHMKTAVIDHSTVIMGSQNWSKNGEEKNDENLLLIKNNSKLAMEVTQYFERLWKTLKKPTNEVELKVSAESKYSINSCFDGMDNDFNHQVDSKDKKCQ